MAKIGKLKKNPDFQNFELLRKNVLPVAHIFEDVARRFHFVRVTIGDFETKK